MKIRTDFVTNSSSSSFVVEVEVETSDGARYVFESPEIDEGSNSNFHCTGEQIARTDSVSALCGLLEGAMSGTGKSKFKQYTGEIGRMVDSRDQIDTVTLRRIWITRGESSGWTVFNDQRLQSLARQVTGAEGEAREQACQEMKSYLDGAEVYAEGGWQDCWPTGFCGSQAVPRYQWEYLGHSVAELAQAIVSGRIDNNDLAVEEVAVDMRGGTVSESARFLVGSDRRGIGRKPACKPLKLFHRTVRSAFPDLEMGENVPVAELVPGTQAPCDPVDIVLYRNGAVRAALSIKTAKNSRSKSFKATGKVCQEAGLPYRVLDEKKDDTGEKILTRVHEALYASVFDRYVAAGETQGLTELGAEIDGDGCTVRVKFADNRAYAYNACTGIRVGDVVYVEGAKQGMRGMVVLLTGEKAVCPYGVVRILRAKEE